MSKKFITLIVALLSFALPLLAESDIPLADSGRINISKWDFSKDYALLHGQYEFYWDTLIGPGGFNEQTESLREFIKVPSAWSAKKAGSHPVKGMATYRLTIHTDSLEGVYGIRIHDHFTASKVWFDGKLIYQAGTVGDSKITSDPRFAYRDIPIFLTKDKSDHELVAHISNFHHTRSGIVKAVKFGKFDELEKESRNWLITILIIVGIILFISINHLLNYFLYKNEITHLMFGLLCLVMILRNVSTGQRVLVYLIPNINWQLLFKFDNFSGFGTIPLFAIFLYFLYRKEFPKIFLQILVGLGAIITAIVLFTPQIFYGKIRMFYELYVLVGGLFLTFFVLLRAALRKKEGGLLTFIGFFILYATAINDVLISMNVVSGAEVAPYGLLVYMLLQSFVLSRGSAQAIKENRQLSKALKKEKLFLEDRVSERTKELEDRNKEITEKQDILKNQSWVNESLAKINIVLNTHNKSGLDVLSGHLVSKINEVLDAQVGVIYLINEAQENPKLELVGAKNASHELMNAEGIAPGEGLLGACYLDREPKIFNNVSDTYVKLDSGLGKTELRNLILIPLYTSDESIGVIEIASYHEFSSKQIKLLEKISDSISSTIQFVRLSTKNIKLLEEYKDKQSILDQNEEDMQNYLMELEALREEVEDMRKNNTAE